MALILLRHTRPLGAEGLCYGRSDLPLAECFAGRANELAAELPPFARIVTSPLSRCRLLAEALSAARQRPLTVDERLIEMDFGLWEGRAWAALPRHELDEWAADLEGARPHGGESVRTMAQRARAALRAAAAGPGPALIVTHAGIIKAALATRQGRAGWEAQPAFGTWLTLTQDWEGPPDV